MKQKQNKNIEKTQNRTDPTMARLCTDARLTVRRRMVVRHRRTAVRWFCQRRLVLPGVDGRVPLWHARALPYFPLLCYSRRSGIPQTSNLP